MAIPVTNQLLTVLIALVWAVNGIGCKLLNIVPRHTEIVAAILGSQFSRQITIAIGFAETLLAIWIITGKFRKPTAMLQILLVLIMNIIEFSLVPDLLLWGKLNLIFAIMFSGLIYIHAFKLKPQENT
jgi:hypothetical protein